MNLDAGDMIKAVSDLLRRGYAHEYRISAGQLYDLTAAQPVAIGDVHVDAALSSRARLMRATARTSMRSPTGRPAARAC
jgi:hypothetical protein